MPNAAESAQRHFFSSLKQWSSAPPSHQIDSLKQFIRRYPDYQPAWLTLEEKLVHAEQADQLFDFLQHFSKSQNSSNAQWMLGRYFQFVGEPDKALAHFEKAIQEQPQFYQTLFDYLEAAFHNGRLNEAAAFLSSFRFPPEQETAVHAYILQLEEQYAEAIRLYQSIHPVPDVIIDVNFYKSLYRNAQSSAALRLAQTARARARDKGDFYHEEYFLLAEIKCRYWQDSNATINADVQLLENMLDRNDNKIVRASLIQFKAYKAQKEDRLEDAILYNRTALNEFLKFHDWRLVTRCYQDLADAYYKTNRNVLALQTLEESISFADKLDNDELSAWSWWLYGMIYRDLTLYRLSAQYFERAKRDALKTENPNLLENIDISIKELQALQVPPSRAAELYAEWLNDLRAAEYETDIFFPTYSLALKLENMGEYDNAYSYYAKACEHAKARDRLGQRAWARAGMAGIELRRGLDQKALDDLQNALQIADSLEDTDLAHVVHFRLGKFYESQYELDKAIQHYETAIHLSESGRNNLKAEELAIGFLSDRQEPYQRQAECYVKKYYAEKNNADLENIFRCEELTHARVLKDEILTADSRRHLQDAELLDYNKLCDNFQMLQRQLRTSRKDISQEALDSLLAEIQLYKYDLISEKIRLGNLDSTQSSHMNTAKLQDIQEQLANQTAILYHVTDRSSFALVVQADTCSVVPLPLSSSAMDSLIGVVMTPLHNVEAKDVFTIPFHATAAHILYSGLFKPIENACQLTSQILIIPSGSLAHLPFEILLTKEPSAAFYTPKVTPEYADHFLCRQYDFYYSPSTHIVLRQPTRCAPGLLIVADPFKGESDLTEESFTLRLRTGWRFNPLPYAHVEASLISRFCPKSKILTQGKATEQRVLQLAPHYGILHIASHAFVDTTFDVFSGLALAEDKYNDGLLMGFEIANAHFPCNLITLSACETGRGKLIHGEGVLGLPRQFLLSGSRSVIMSNWKVDDEFTADFMPRFYAYVLRDGLPKANALANAKRDVLDARDANTDFHYQHPFFWAAFNLYGDAGKMNEIPMDRSRSPHILLMSIPLIAAGFILLALLRKKWASSR